MSKDMLPIEIAARWAQTIVAPLITGLFAGGVLYSFMPNKFGQTLSIVIALIGFITGLIILISRIVLKKGPPSLYFRKYP